MPYDQRNTGVRFATKEEKIMKLKDQVCSLELAKRLKELGVKQESLWQWAKKVKNYYQCSGFESTRDLEGFALALNKNLVEGKPRNNGAAYCARRGWIFSAFTVAELGEMMPDKVNGFRLEYWPTGDNKHGVRYFEDDHEGGESRFDAFAETEADARAKMLIYLIENKLIELPIGEK